MLRLLQDVTIVVVVTVVLVVVVTVVLAETTRSNSVTEINRFEGCADVIWTPL